jgi:hypothetical protein
MVVIYLPTYIQTNNVCTSPFIYFKGTYPLVFISIYRVCMYEYIYGCNYVFPYNVIMIYVSDMYMRTLTLHYIEFDKRFIFLGMLI